MANYNLVRALRYLDPRAVTAGATYLCLPLITELLGRVVCVVYTPRSCYPRRAAIFHNM